MERLEELRDRILPVLLPCGIKRVAVFGSVARGEDAPGSDVDVLVKLKPPKERAPLGLFKWMALEEKLSQALGRKVDLVSEDGISPYIRPYVEREKVVLYEE